MKYAFFECCNCGYQLRLATELAGAKPEPNPEPIKAGRATVPRSKRKTNRFAYDVSILLDITVDDVKTLQECSKQHYDGVCQSAGAIGGFLYGWLNLLDFANDGWEGTEIYATAREIGTCSKILERTPHYSLYCRLRAAANALSLEHCQVNGLGLANDCQRIANPRCGGSTPPDASD
jgi:hypothetical protein